MSRSVPDWTSCPREANNPPPLSTQHNLSLLARPPQHRTNSLTHSPITAIHHITCIHADPHPPLLAVSKRIPILPKAEGGTGSNEKDDRQAAEQERWWAAQTTNNHTSKRGKDTHHLHNTQPARKGGQGGRDGRVFHSIRRLGSRKGEAFLGRGRSVHSHGFFVYDPGDGVGWWWDSVLVPWRRDGNVLGKLVGAMIGVG